MHSLKDPGQFGRMYSMEIRSNTNPLVEAEAGLERLPRRSDQFNDELQQVVILTQQLEALQKELALLLAAIMTYPLPGAGEKTPPPPAASHKGG